MHELEKLGLHHTAVNLGEVDIEENLSSATREQLKAALLPFGLELMDNRKSILVERIKKIIIETIQYSHDPPKLNYSTLLAEKLNHDYTYLANLFSESEGTTIEHYIILVKIERVKELLMYNELSVKEISYRLHYSSVAHLSSQFKKITGLTTTRFKNLKDHPRNCLENL